MILDPLGDWGRVKAGVGFEGSIGVTLTINKTSHIWLRAECYYYAAERFRMNAIGNRLAR